MKNAILFSLTKFSINFDIRWEVSNGQSRELQKTKFSNSAVELDMFASPVLAIWFVNLNWSHRRTEKNEPKLFKSCKAWGNSIKDKILSDDQGTVGGGLRTISNSVGTNVVVSEKALWRNRDWETFITPKNWDYENREIPRNENFAKLMVFEGPFTP